MAWLARLTASALGAGKTEQKSEKGSERRKKTKKNNKKTHFILPEQNLIENCEKHTETQNHTFINTVLQILFFFFFLRLMLVELGVITVSYPSTNQRKMCYSMFVNCDSPNT